MFLTAFVWGLGVSCGAAFGMVLFCVMFYGLKFLTGNERSQRENLQGSLAALCERNVIGACELKELARIADAMEHLHDKRTS